VGWRGQKEWREERGIGRRGRRSHSQPRHSVTHAGVASVGKVARRRVECYRAGHGTNGQKRHLVQTVQHHGYHEGRDPVTAFASPAVP